MKNAMKLLVLPVVLSTVFVLSGCARDRTALLGMPAGGCGGGGCGGGSGAGGYASTPSCHAPGGAAMAQSPMTGQPVPQSQVASAGGVINHKLCPVMGEPLGSMGDPVPVTVGGETLFVCCRGCVKKVKADPAKYFAIARNE